MGQGASKGSPMKHVCPSNKTWKWTNPMLVQRHCAVYIHLHMLDFLFVRLDAVTVPWSSSESDGAETSI